MTEFCKNIFDNFQVRKTTKQKDAFIELIKSKYDVTIEKGGFGKNKNIIFGDVSKANTIVTAHYDTCAVLPFPNFIAPRNFLLSFGFQLVIVLVIFAIAGIIPAIISQFVSSTSPEVNLVLDLIPSFVLIALLFLIFAGKPNKHTANDNTSGVITVLETIEALNKEKENVAFVLFDNEENGLLGSAFFKSKHKKELKTKLIINLDCVSDGDTIMVIKNKNAQKKFGSMLEESFKSSSEKNILTAKAALTFYPSDQIWFKSNVALCSVKKKPLLGYHVDRIHTKYDTKFDEKNIEFIRECLVQFVIKNA